MKTAARAWLHRLRVRLEAADAAGLRRVGEPLPAGLIDCGSNDYLALRRHPHLIEASRRAAEEQGVGSGASRLAGGTLDTHLALERRFAAFKGADDARLLPTGYMANLALLTSVVQAEDLILSDRLNHASLIDAAALSAARTRATARTYPHRSVDAAGRMAIRHLERAPEAGVWLVTDSVFSMDGDLADLHGLGTLRNDIADQFPNAAVALLVDEAHATGVLGETGGGLDESVGHVADAVVSTASKALGSLGGIITGPTDLLRTIDHFARPFIYSTATPPMVVATIDAALDVVEREPERRARLADISRRVRAALRDAEWDVRGFETDPTPIIPLITGESRAALALAARLRERGVLGVGVRPPSVPKGSARVRLSLHAGLTDAEVERVIEAVGRPVPA